MANLRTFVASVLVALSFVASAALTVARNDTPCSVEGVVVFNRRWDGWFFILDDKGNPWSERIFAKEYRLGTPCGCNQTGVAKGNDDFLTERFDEETNGPLTAREAEVLRYINLGKTHEEIGIITGLSPETVRSHVKGIYRKLDCANAAGAVGRAYELGILRP